VPVRKISIALEEGTAQAAAEAAARRGVSLSSWLNQAAEHALRVDAGLRAVQAWEAEHGALTASELEAADRFLAKARRRRTRGS
jgi:hypothetical protein